MSIVENMVNGKFKVSSKKKATRLVVGTNNLNNEGVTPRGYVQVAKVTLEDGTILQQHKTYINGSIYPKTTYYKLKEGAEIEVQFVEENHDLEEVSITYLSTEEKENKVKLEYVSKFKKEVKDLMSLYKTNKNDFYKRDHTHENLDKQYKVIKWNQLKSQMTKYLIDGGFQEISGMEEYLFDGKKEFVPIFTDDLYNLNMNSTFIGKGLKETAIIILNRLALNQKYNFLQLGKEYSKKEQQDIESLKMYENPITMKNFGLAANKFVMYMELKNGE